MITLHHDGISRPLDGARLKLLSLGAGVQSTTLLLMADRGDIERPNYAVFADTGWEPQAVYEHLDRLRQRVSIPIITVSRSGRNLGDAMLAIARGEIEESGQSLIPYFVEDGMIPKQCSKEYKTRVVASEARSLAGIPARGPGKPVVEMWLGISLDEIVRCKTNEKPWIQNRWPLIEARMSRRDCLKWLEERQESAPRSSCIFCPFRTHAEWRAMRDEAPNDWTRAIAFDRGFRTAHPSGAYLTKDKLPLQLVDLSAPEDPTFNILNECEGMCGV